MYNRVMTPAFFIRKKVLGMTQEALAAALGRKQPTIHRWEQEGHFPRQVQPKVRELGQKATPDWSDSWFFEVPDETLPEVSGKAA